MVVFQELKYQLKTFVELIMNLILLNIEKII